MRKKNLFLRILFVLLAFIAVLALVVLAFIKFAVRPPDVKPGRGGDEVVDNEEDGTQPHSSDTSSRSGDKYTFLILGTDDGNGNTDTMMVATLDTNNYTLNVVSIPRDTLVNVSWSIKKVNSLYGVGGIDRVLSGVSELLGYEVDFYAIIDLDAFVKLVDAIGGVYYDVPVNMYYNDPAQDLYIDIAAGPQYLDGATAVKVVRFRKSYVNGDIGRIDTQQDFLKTMAEQILQNVDNISVTTLADVFINNVETDLKIGNVIWFAKECLKLDPENITFQKLPGNYNDWINGSYVSIYVDEWLEMINTSLNPFDEPIKESDLNILTRNSSGMLYSTSGVYAGDPSWGNYSSSYGSNDDDDDEPAETAPETTDPPELDPETGEPITEDPGEGETEPGDPNYEDPSGGETDPNEGGAPGEGDPGEGYSGEGDLEEGDPEEDPGAMISG